MKMMFLRSINVKILKRQQQLLRVSATLISDEHSGLSEKSTA
jgi:hypothetical protein